MQAKNSIKTCGYLPSSPVFAHLSPLQQQLLIDMLKPITFSKDQTIYQRGDTEPLFYFIFKGLVEFEDMEEDDVDSDDSGADDAGALLTDDDLGVSFGIEGVVELIRCGPTEGFGEDMFLGAAARLATAKAIEDTVCLYLHRKDLKIFMNKAQRLSFSGGGGARGGGGGARALRKRSSFLGEGFAMYAYYLFYSVLPIVPHLLLFVSSILFNSTCSLLDRSDSPHPDIL